MAIFHKRLTGVNRLRKLHVFRDCSTKELAIIDRLTFETTFPAGASVCREGEIGLEAFVIVAGQAEISAGGRVIAEVGPGHICGEGALLDYARRVTTVTAVTPLVALAMSTAELQQLARTAPAAVRQLLVSLALRVRQLEHLAGEFPTSEPTHELLQAVAV